MTTSVIIKKLVVWGTVSILSFAILSLNPSLNPVSLSPVPILAQTSVDVKTDKFTGELIKKDDNKITLQSNSMTKDFLIPSSIKINRDTLSSSINKLEIKDQVTVTTNSETGLILSVEAVNGGLFDYAKYVVPGGIFLLLVVGFAYYLLKQSQTGRIKTTTATRL
jgi:hypothetical protein